MVKRTRPFGVPAAYYLFHDRSIVAVLHHSGPQMHPRWRVEFVSGVGEADAWQPEAPINCCTLAWNSN